MKTIFLAAAVLLCAAACRRSLAPVSPPLSPIEITGAGGQPVLLGHAPVSALQQPAYKNWFEQSWNSYTPDIHLKMQLAQALAGKRVDIFLGTWCGDSRREVPRMLKILHEAGLDSSRISLVFVNNTAEAYKQSPQHEERGKNIHHVPTFIIYDGKKELGRIIESPVVSLEQDLLSITGGNNYQSHYKGVAYWIRQVAGREKPMTDASLAVVAVQIRPLAVHSGEFSAYGRMQAAAGATAEAINVYKLNTLLYPRQSTVWNALADVLVSSGNPKAAINAYEKVLELEPGNDSIAEKIKGLKEKAGS